MSSQFLPFGQEIPSGTDTNHYKFTGKERDAETSGGVPGAGNDYFGARYYASSMGRFMSPDWSKNPEGVPYADLSNPQTLDLYSYVDNNPLTHSDVDGHIQAPAQTNGLPAVDAGTDSSYNGTPVPGGDAYNSMAGQAAWAFLTGGNPAAASSAWAQQQYGDPTLPTAVKPPAPNLADRIVSTLLNPTAVNLAVLIGTDGLGEVVEAGAALLEGAATAARPLAEFFICCLRASQLANWICVPEDQMHSVNFWCPI
jgi:RHS repeat-associated protein